MAQASDPGNACRYPACGAVLLSSEKLFWRQAGEADQYDVPFPFAEYEKLVERLRSIKGRAIVSLSDHPGIRRVFDGFRIESVPIQCTVGGGKVVERREPIIFSWDAAAQPVGLF
ncbi:Site-specific DNA methylase [Burkholderia oklahomensis]|nr:putative dNA adenine methylase [Burkholderia oklahomensis C6786]SUW60286.1 Site-specific DNA methylase [Burkholderia oklahomensis]